MIKGSSRRPMMCFDPCSSSLPQHLTQIIFVHRAQLRWHPFHEPQKMLARSLSTPWHRSGNSALCFFSLICYQVCNRERRTQDVLFVCSGWKMTNKYISIYIYLKRCLAERCLDFIFPFSLVDRAASVNSTSVRYDSLKTKTPCQGTQTFLLESFPPLSLETVLESSVLGFHQDLNRIFSTKLSNASRSRHPIMEGGKHLGFGWVCEPEVVF